MPGPLRYVLSVALFGTLHCSSSSSGGPSAVDGGGATEGGTGDDGSSASGSDGAGGDADANDADAGDGSLPVNPNDWASWPMPNSAVDVEAGAPNPEKYTTNSDGTVTDQVTGLVWSPVASSVNNYPGAEAYCASLQLAGMHDWRLPTYIELISIADYSQTPTINATVFAGIATAATMHTFLSATLWAAPIHVRTIDYTQGTTRIDRPDAQFSTVCVRGGKKATSASRYTTGNGTVTDNQTLLTWQSVVNNPSYMPAEAKTYCSTLSVGGVSGWRVPTVKELATLVDAPHLATVDLSVFPDFIGSTLWSSTPGAGASAPGGWVIDFTGANTFDTQAGDIEGQPATLTSQVRCVK